MGTTRGSSIHIRRDALRQKEIAQIDIDGIDAPLLVYYKGVMQTIHDETIYVVAYHIEADADEATHNTARSLPTEDTLQEIRANCRELSVSAGLTNDFGFSAGSVSADGNYILS